MEKISTSSIPSIAKPSKSHQIIKWIVIASGALVILLMAAFAIMVYRMNYVPAELNTSTSLATDNGLFNASYTAQSGTITVNQIHSWNLRVQTPDGIPVENATIAVDGDMPQHGHGLPTQPQVTRYLGEGEYLVEGLKFHMPGWWIVEFDITHNGQTDHVTFNLLLQ